MEFITKINNVYNFYFLKNELLIRKKNTLINFNQKKVLEKNIKSFQIKKDWILIKKDNEFSISNEKNKVLINGVFRLDNAFIFNEFCINTGKIDKVKKYYLINTKNNTITDFSPKPYYPHYMINKERGIIASQNIEAYNPFSGEIFWSSNITKLLKNENATLYGKPQIIKNKLFFFLFDSSRQTDINGTFCLDLESGIKIWKSDSIGGWLKTFQEKVYSLHMKTVKVLNPSTFEIEIIDLTEQLSVLDKKVYDKTTDYNWEIPFRFSVSRYFVKNSTLYFTQDKQNTIGAIDLRKKQLLWYTEIKIESGDIIPIVTDIKFNDNKLYVLDSGNSLHIYKEQK